MAKFSVFRYDSGDGAAPRFQDYDLPDIKGMTVLEGLFYILEEIDPTLAFRCSCREAVCGSCAMHINGKYTLACKTQISALQQPVTVRPLAHLPIIKDLVVDLTQFWENYKTIKPYLIPAEKPPEKEFLQSPEQRKKLDPHVDCILCAACYGSCPVSNGDPDYLGPHALLKALRFVEDSRDGAKHERLAIVAKDVGVFRCHTIFNCQKVCPRDLDPTGAISKLKIKILVDKMPFLKFLDR
jgi:succinate dehydrogenase / fumarate reductase, iron-sulfur subunit